MSFLLYRNLRCASEAFNNLIRLRIDLLDLERSEVKGELDQAYIAKKKAEVLIATLILKDFLKDIPDLSIFSIALD